MRYLPSVPSLQHVAWPHSSSYHCPWEELLLQVAAHAQEFVQAPAQAQQPQLGRPLGVAHHDQRLQH